MKPIFCAVFILFSYCSYSQVEPENPPEDPEIIEEIDGRAIVKVNDKYGVMKKKKYLVPAYFDTLYEAAPGFYMVFQNGKTGIFDKKGRMVVPVAYQSITVIDEFAEVFEVYGIGIRAVYISQAHNALIGSIKVSNTAFAKQTEVTLLDWIFFMKEVAEDGASFDIEKILPDTTKMDPDALRAYRYYVNRSVNSTYREKYRFGFKSSVSVDLFFDKKINDDPKAKTALHYPVTGITYEQAKLYCSWLTELYNGDKYFDVEGFTIDFRLPTASEWEEMAIAGLNENMRTHKALDSVNVKGCALFNYKVTSKCSNYETLLKHNVGLGLCEGSSFWPSTLGLYGMFGNAAEMVSEKTIAKGGAYCHYAKQCAGESSVSYSGAQPWLGFRYVAELKVGLK